MRSKLKIIEKGRLWIYEGVQGNWHFLTVGKSSTQKIKEYTFMKKRRGFGSIRVTVSIGKNIWQTSIFPDKSGVYLLPVKRKIRQENQIYAGDLVSFSLLIIDC